MSRGIKIRQGGFTLVELLVVIGIIALLISILLPSLNKAREQAKLAVCMSNLRSLTQAVQIYQAQYKGAVPPSWTWTNGATPSLGNVQPPCLYAQLTSLPVNSNVRLCPSVYDRLSQPTIQGPDVTKRQGLFSYKYNATISGVDVGTTIDVGGTAVGHPIKAADSTGATIWIAQPLKRIPNATETVMFSDYPQIQTFSMLDNRGFKNGTANLRPYWSPFIINSHQTIGDTAPVHGMIRPSVNVPNPVINTYVMQQGLINVAYCDGSVRTIEVKQGLVGQLKVNFNNDPSGGGTGYTLPGTGAIWPGTRIDPTQAP